MNLGEFQIKNSNGIAIPINELDAEAAAFWGKEVQKKEYANPTPLPNYEGLDDQQKNQAYFVYTFRHAPNWFDTIGYQIANPAVQWTEGWNNIKASLWSLHSTDMYTSLQDIEYLTRNIPDEHGNLHSKADIDLMVKIDHLKPYFELIDHWESKGYQPIRIAR